MTNEPMTGTQFTEGMSAGICGAIDGMQCCAKPAGHNGRHGWEPDTSLTDACYDVARALLPDHLRNPLSVAQLGASIERNVKAAYDDGLL